ncbi:MAG: hypothetical protein A2700_01265 [Candidatus Blackburnbacteria bacterium RIFCSPHIGHO2_01_FULL_44_64]|uniref:Uncharacterized protein n=1 Tax=Candidatus Blackburnbacteria bacterium RIFCSPHIGHO2_02_FULL_44_20 TaxID=1797516 RepID=A0A1G1V6H0_9BACT|nr:MAG: hypothetical protein A2700_01265 [Candidatus Blackburnbacteria bacterium RIFCSPHIGHO2_01_FULL_44_64]OGY10713.1 MAG: hypothetical protein A3E16_01800 [Candidatus Blackburnbacteria bacterium RIFCSPHIGHO2_12_FULL_44_25]OGY11015.1 MAG: hypothetical protein A3D26_03810 [Candidatus Blackburnbacteria bacterium RIFCSPHIGHO2_02_FULL_44_20]OGY15209.1 MAG: hypothetical protein A3A62_02560 [Candidatus Blackburnbacteria bacterium RIFCSPLOWO2_01_FULL_44_43]OGY15845.1 MAG: hypothetical protein A3H88_0
MANLLTKIFVAASGLVLVAIAVLQVREPINPVRIIPSPPVVMAEASGTVTVGSPDGKSNLTMKTEKGEAQDIYTFFIQEKDGVESEIYKKNVPAGTAISIPFNTFSPDNKYLLLKEASSASVIYFVVSTNGKPFSEDLPVAEITTPFLLKYEKYNITDVTGWGGLNLVVINTDKKAGGTGPSFWFDVSSRSFIQLSTRF